MEKLPISVVILTKNSEATIQQCIESVYRSSSQEIIVVDGYSTDKTIDIIKQYISNIYFDEGKGLCYARQLGAEVASGEYVAYVDSDIILLPDTLKTMLTELKTKGYGGMTARALISGATGYFGWALTRYKNVINPDRPRETKVVTMKATIFPRELVLKYKFDLSTPSWDDASLSLRLIENGHKLGVSSAVVYHYHPPGREGRGAYWIGVAIAESLLKYRKSPAILIRYTLLRGLGVYIQGLVLSIAKGDLRLIPYFMYLAGGQAAGFISKLFSALLALLSKKWKR